MFVNEIQRCSSNAAPPVLTALAFEMLMARIRNPLSPVRETFLTAPLVVRDSTWRSGKNI